MTDKELKRMSRQELLDELYEYARENAELRLRLENREEELRQHFHKIEQELIDERKKVVLLKEQMKLQDKRNADLSDRLQKRSVIAEDAGNIADATCKITGIFESAQKTADLYVQSVKELTEKQEQALQEMKETSRRTIQELEVKSRIEIKKMEEKSRRDIQNLGDEASKTCIAMRTQTEKECSELRKKTEAECKQMKREAYFKAEEYWENLSERLEKFYAAHQGMKELFGDAGIRIPTFRDSQLNNGN